MSRDLHREAALLNALILRRNQLRHELAHVTAEQTWSWVHNHKRELAQLDRRIARLEAKLR